MRTLLRTRIRERMRTLLHRIRYLNTVEYACIILGPYRICSAEVVYTVRS
jgi:hypothetical protein